MKTVVNALEKLQQQHQAWLDLQKEWASEKASVLIDALWPAIARRIDGTLRVIPTIEHLDLFALCERPRGDAIAAYADIVQDIATLNKLGLSTGSLINAIADAITPEVSQRASEYITDRLEKPAWISIVSSRHPCGGECDKVSCWEVRLVGNSY